MRCLYRCESGAGSTQEYHLYPKSAGPLEVKLRKGLVCDRCNQYFGRKLEKYFVERHPGTRFRLGMNYRTHKGKRPVLVGCEDRRVEVRAESSGDLVTEAQSHSISYREEGEKLVFTCATRLPGYEPRKVSRVLAKMAFETLSVNGELPDHLSVSLCRLREYARRNKGSYIPFTYVIGQKIEQIPPGLVEIKTSGVTSHYVALTFPCIQYLLPINEEPKIAALDGWVPVNTAEPRDVTPLKLEIPLIRLPSPPEE